eukprot:g5654.t1
MLPLSLLKTAQGRPILIELKTGDTYNGTLVDCDNWMNLNLREVVHTSKDGAKFWKMDTCYVRGSQIKYLRMEEDIIDKVPRQQSYRGGRGNGRGRGESIRGRGGTGNAKSSKDGKKNDSDKPTTGSGNNGGAKPATSNNSDSGSEKKMTALEKARARMKAKKEKESGSSDQK